jgi:hypothetical protein
MKVLDGLTSVARLRSRSAIQQASFIVFVVALAGLLTRSSALVWSAVGANHFAGELVVAV